MNCQAMEGLRQHRIAQQGKGNAQQSAARERKRTA
nr:MAG TPA: hypothetical protein [Caudoviricetes sp.]